MEAGLQVPKPNWPAQPDVYGWLSLDTRGRWRLRGETISNHKLIAFINRNYQRQSDGAYAFHNGSQRVFVSLESTPWIATAVYAEAALIGFEDHCGVRLAGLHTAYLAQGQLIIDSDRGPALLRDDELAALLPAFRDDDGESLSDDRLAAALELPCKEGLQLACDDHLLPLKTIDSDDLAAFFGFVSKPRRRRG